MMNMKKLGIIIIGFIIQNALIYIDYNLFITMYDQEKFQWTSNFLSS